MKRYFVMRVVAAIASVVVPGLAQEPQMSQATPDLSGTGHAKYLPIWTNSTTLGNSVIYATGGNVGIGTTTPAAKLEVNGEAQVDGNLNLSGELLSGGTILLQVPGGMANGNTALGLGALPSNTAGTGMTAIGAGALALGTGGFHNTAVGNAALSSNSVGCCNTAIGWSALGANTGTANTASGGLALSANTSGNDNTAYGYHALNQNLTGSNNIAVGANAGINVLSSNNIHIGTVGSSSDTGTIRIGGNTTLGDPANQSSFFAGGIRGVQTGNADAVPVVIDSNGQLGTISSSRRYKEIIQDMGDASDGLMRLRPVTFRYKKAYADGSKPLQYGLIAEEVAAVYPDLVTRTADGQVETVKYQLLDPMLLNELQKEHATIKAQQEQIRSLEERLARLEAALGTAATTTASR
ncbi:MAG TPA: tail fiber domain-containing protein [Bryobacteraceae bacterium]|nr:tail fiber domain-containing protein [Bryobacteraceae bacterium]